MQVFEFIDDKFLALSRATSMEEDQLKVVVAWLVCIPLGLVQDLLRDRFIRNMYSLIFGLFLSYMCIKQDMFITLSAAIITYFLTSFLQSKSAIPVFVFNFAILIGLHTHRYIVDPMGWKMDGTTSMMLIICKLTYFSFFFADGRIPKLPNLLEFLGYIYFYPSAIIGPAFNFNIYNEFIQRQGHYSYIPQLAKIKATLTHLGLAIAYILGYKFVYPLFTIEILHTQWFLEGNFLIQLLAINLLGIFYRFKYFIAWKLSQAGMNASGITYHGHHKFNRIQSMGDRFELEPNPRFKTEMWNSSVQIWLKECFYDKFAPRLGQNRALFLTFIVSALWHGVHPIYYFGFLQWALMNEVTKLIYRSRSKFTWLKSPFQKPVIWFLGNSAVTYMGLGIALLDWTAAIKYYSSMKFIPLIAQIFIYFFLSISKWGVVKHKKTKDPSSIEQNETTEGKPKDPNSSKKKD